MNGDSSESTGPGQLALSVGLALVLVALSGLFSGLNLGLLSFTDDDLGLIIAGSDDSSEIKYAKRIRPLRKRGNLLLCTLVLGCTLLNAVVAVLLADLANGVIGTILTTGAAQHSTMHTASTMRTAYIVHAVALAHRITVPSRVSSCVGVGLSMAWMRQG